MSVDGEDPNADALIGLWRFMEDAETDDTGLADTIAQNGRLFGDARVVDGRLILDGRKDYFTTNGDDDPFDIDQATVHIELAQGRQPNKSADVLINRGEFNDKSKDGYFAILKLVNHLLALALRCASHDDHISKPLLLHLKHHASNNL